MKWRRWVVWLSAAAVITLTVCFVSALLVTQTAWFKEQIRRRMIAAVENTTGARVDFQAFTYDWRALTVTIDRLTLHGTEPVTGPPLFTARRVQVRLKIISVFERKIDLDSISIDQPETFSVVRPDGTTNIPVPQLKGKERADVQLISLGVKHFQIHRGSAEIDGRKYPFEINARQLSAEIAFNVGAAAYRGNLKAQRLKIDSPYNFPVLARFETGFDFSTDHLGFNQFLIATESSRVNGSASLDHFAHPVMTAQIASDADVREVFSLFRINQLRGGRATLTGNATYESGRYRFEGTVQAADLSYRDRDFRLAPVSLQSSVVAQNEGLSLTRLRVRSLGATAMGNADLSAYRYLRWQGVFSNLNVREAARFLTPRAVAWDGIASGSFSLRGRLGEHLRDFVLQLSSSISSGSRGIPVNGSVSFIYRQPTHQIELSSSELHLPNTSVQASGTVGVHLAVNIDTSNLADAEPAIAVLSPEGQIIPLPVHLENGHAHFSGTIDGPLGAPVITGQVKAEHARFQSILLDSADASVHVTSNEIDLQSARLTQGELTASASGSIALTDWKLRPDSALELSINARHMDLALLRSELRLNELPLTKGTGSLSARLTGTPSAPRAALNINASGLQLAGETLDSVEATLLMNRDEVVLTNGQIHAFHSSIKLQGSYRRESNWKNGALALQADAPGIEIQNLAVARAWEPALTGRVDAHGRISGRVEAGRFAPSAIDGQLRFNDVSLNGAAYGSLSADARTETGTLFARLNGKLLDSGFSGSARAQLAGDYASSVEISVTPLKLSSLALLIPQFRGKAFPFEGTVQGTGNLAGPLAHPTLLRGTVRLDRLEFAPRFTGSATQTEAALEAITVRTRSPVVINLAGGQAAIQEMKLTARDTQLSVAGRMGMGGPFPLNLKINGDVNLPVLETFIPNIKSAGSSHIDTAISGTLLDPTLNGTVSVTDASLYLPGFTNGIDHANGTLRFDSKRATIQRFTATSGGGDVDINGLMTFGGSTPAIFRLNADAHRVRVRYNGVSITFNAAVKYSGTLKSSMLAGDVTVMRAAFNPSTDVGNLFAAYSSTAPLLSPQNGYLHSIQLALSIQSSSSLQLTTSVSQDVQAEIDLHLRGTPDRPVVLGRCSVNEGQIQFFGNKYSINRGDVNFFNPLKIEPVLDLDLQTQSSGITINITVSGPLEKLNVSYRSDPPLQPNEIIALLATGRAPNVASGYATSQLSQNAVLSSGGNTILGSAISPVSNRLQRFFGVTHLKIDPMVQGIEDVPQARLTLEQQISPQVSITYVTNLSRTAEQIFRFEWALSREYSVVAIRDENGLFGVDIQYKRRFK